MAEVRGNAEYYKARRDPTYRQHFLDKLDLSDASSYVSELIYVKEDKRRSPFKIGLTKTTFMETNPSWLTKFSLKGTRSKIYIYPSAFDENQYPVLDDFLTALIYHEGYHAREIYDEPNRIVCPILKDILDVLKAASILLFDGWTCEKITSECELRALENEKEKAATRNTSSEYRARLEEKLNGARGDYR